jgi:enoyl-CoA hydratase/carnithine racemase
MKGSGRAFCVGGDVVNLHKLITEGEWFDGALCIALASS